MKDDSKRETLANRLAVVVPAYNEQEVLGEVLGGIRRSVPGAEMIVVDDGSEDGTAAVARANGARVIQHSFNLGCGAALQTGFLFALRGGFEYVVHLDADGQHDPADIPTLLQPLRAAEADVVIGSRFLGGAGYPVTVLRMLGMRFFRGITSLIIRQRITDSTSGFQALNREALRVHTSKFYPPDYPDADVIVMLHLAGLRIREVPVRMRPNPHNRSMHRGVLVKAYYVFKLLVSILVVLLSAGQYRAFGPTRCGLPAARAAAKPSSI